MEELNKVRNFLAQLPYKLEVIEFSQSTHTSALAAEALGVTVGQIAKSLLFVGERGRALVVTSGDMRVNAKKLKALMGGKVKFAEEETVKEVTGFPPGGVCPFALKHPLKVYVDSSLERFPVVYAAAGTPNSAVPVTVQQLLEVTGGELCDLA
ncbi:MAG TPA: YbaK/EbsC family protein [Bacillota bacterium]|nr:YbaK/EbsC family protein [Bacillota bacterium]